MKTRIERGSRKCRRSHLPWDPRSRLGRRFLWPPSCGSIGVFTQALRWLDRSGDTPAEAGEERPGAGRAGEGQGRRGLARAGSEVELQEPATGGFKANQLEDFGQHDRGVRELQTYPVGARGKAGDVSADHGQKPGLTSLEFGCGQFAGQGEVSHRGRISGGSGSIEDERSPSKAEEGAQQVPAIGADPIHQGQPEQRANEVDAGIGGEGPAGEGSWGPGEGPGEAQERGGGKEGPGWGPVLPKAQPDGLAADEFEEGREGEPAPTGPCGAWVKTRIERGSR